MSICDYVYIAAGGACRVQKRALDPLGLELLAVVGHHMWVLGTELGSLKEQYMLLTADPSLQSQCVFLVLCLRQVYIAQTA